MSATVYLVHVGEARAGKFLCLISYMFSRLQCTVRATKTCDSNCCESITQILLTVNNLQHVYSVLVSNQVVK